MVESEVVERGYRVLGVDAIEIAVRFARAKGVEAVCADISRWSPDEYWSVVYMDGLLGHLYDSVTGLQPVLSRVHSWLAATGRPGIATLVVSNDSTTDGYAAQLAPGVQGFYWLTAEFIRDEILAAGFDDATTEEFRYSRPQSGERARSVVVAHVRNG